MDRIVKFLRVDLIEGKLFLVLPIVEYRFVILLLHLLDNLRQTCTVQLLMSILVMSNSDF